ncbi:response regulator [Planctomycetota bacterium]
MREAIRILMAEDDPDDRMLARDALEEARLVNHIDFVEDGEELMAYLREEPPPGLILLDLNMPKKDGREALAEIKADPNLRHIPVVVLTTSKEEEDVARTYDLGVNSFIVKPVTFESLVDIMKAIAKYWFEIVRLPSEK